MLNASAVTPSASKICWPNAPKVAMTIPAMIAARVIAMKRARPLMPVFRASTTGTSPMGSTMVKMAVSALKENGMLPS
jgi:hypothetical protein